MRKKGATSRAANRPPREHIRRPTNAHIDDAPPSLRNESETRFARICPIVMIAERGAGLLTL